MRLIDNSEVKIMKWSGTLTLTSLPEPFKDGYTRLNPIVLLTSIGSQPFTRVDVVPRQVVLWGDFDVTVGTTTSRYTAMCPEDVIHI